MHKRNIFSGFLLTCGLAGVRKEVFAEATQHKIGFDERLFFFSAHFNSTFIII